PPAPPPALFSDANHGTQDERTVVLMHPHVHVRIDERVRVFVDRAATEALGARIATLTVIFALARHGVVHVHGAATSIGERTTMLVGSSGSGKTTTTISLVLGGARYLSDDAT